MAISTSLSWRRRAGDFSNDRARGSLRIGRREDRPADHEMIGAGDQMRIMTPAAAIAAGADHLVVGRPILAAADPKAAAGAIIAEIAGAAPP